MSATRSFALTCVLVAAVLVSAGRAGASGFDATITTLAGSGGLGYADGDAKAATFILPVGIALGPQAAVYVADAGSQRIRVIQSGTVRTLAGGGALAPASFWVRGGYRDGKGADARFNFPAGITVSSAGRVYVADADNHCIRAIDLDGTVSTFAGAPARAAELNGPRQAAGFKRPIGITLGPSGDVYVADQQVGLRKIDVHGDVSTVLVDPGIGGVAVSPDGRSILVTNITGGMSLLLDGTRHDLPSSEPLFTGADVWHLANLADIGHPFAAAMIDPYRAIYTDAKNGAVRYIDFLTFVSKVLVGDRELNATNERTGFRDGPLEQALVANPLGVALEASGTLFVADSSNRRIRRIAPLNFRQATIASVSAFPPDISNDGSKNVVIVGSSLVWAGCVWDDSWEGILEKALRAAGKRVTLYPIQMNGAKQDAALDYIANVLPDLPHVDRAIFFVNTGLLGTDTGDWQTDYESKLRVARDALAKKGIGFLVVLSPGPFDVDWQELPLSRYLYQPAAVTGYIDPTHLGADVVGSVYQDMIMRTRASGVPYVDVLPFFMQERRRDTRPLFGTSEGHMTEHGRSVLADSLLGAF